jgi:diguanylate cyclase (GGDEF)-like protein
LLPRIDGKIREFRALTSDNPRQQQNVDLLASQVRRRFEYLTEQLDRRRDVGFAGVQQNSKLAEGRAAMDALNATLTLMTDKENELLALRKADRERSIYGVWATIAAMVIAGCALLAWALRQTLITLRVRRQAAEQAIYLAHHDVLTELPNRRMLQTQLLQAFSAAARHGYHVAVLCLDLDGFKKVNDTLGHDTGDALLKEVATRLVSIIRKEDTAARVGGDEFIVGLMHIQQPGEATVVAQKVIQEFSRPYTCLSQGVSVTTSVGIAFYPDDGRMLEELLKRADMALYEAKSAGKNRFVVAHAGRVGH